MARSARDLFITGLRNAHAMENQAEEMLERQLDSLTDYPEILPRLRQHLDETRIQKRRIEEILGSLGETESTFKDMALSFMGAMQALGHAMAGDEVLKNAFANNAFENYEIAAYKSLLALNEEAGASAAGLLEQSLAEEQAMADWTESSVETVTMLYMRRQQRA